MWWPSDCDTPRKPSQRTGTIGLPIFLATFLGDRLDVVADQADRALGLDGDALGQREQLLDFVDDLGELLVAAEDDVLLLEVGGELHRAEAVDAGCADIVVAACRPGVLTAADRAVAKCGSCP